MAGSRASCTLVQGCDMAPPDLSSSSAFSVYPPGSRSMYSVISTARRSLFWPDEPHESQIDLVDDWIRSDQWVPPDVARIKAGEMRPIFDRSGALCERCTLCDRAFCLCGR